MKKLLCIVLVAVFALSVTGCAGKNAESSSKSPAAQKKLSVVTTIFPPYDFVRQIAGDNAEITMLLKPGSESHTYEPSLADIALIQNCDVFIYVGGNTDSWAEKILNNSKNDNRKVISLLKTVKTFKEEMVEGMTDEEHEDGEHGEDETDEHVWTSPKNAIECVKVISEAMCDADSKNTAVYNSNTTKYIEALTVLDNSISDIVKSAKRKTLLVADRFPFRYFTEEFGLKYYAALKGCSSDTEPTVTTVKYLIEKVESEKIPAVLYIEFSTETVADKICSVTGCGKRLFHSCHNVSKEDFESGTTYIDLMNNNAQVLREVLN